MKRCYVLFGLMLLLTSCSQKESKPAAPENVRVDPELEVQMASDLEKVFLNLDGAKDGQVFKYSKEAEADYSFIIFDHYPNGQDREGKIKSTISLSVGCRESEVVRALHGLEECRIFIKSIKTGASVQQHETCCCPRSFNAPDGHTQMIFDMLKARSVVFKELSHFDSCYQGRWVVE